MKLDTLELIDAGMEYDRKKHEEDEQRKLGNLRAGNTGCVLRDETIVGSCPDRARLRSEGLGDEDIPIDKLIMFELGKANEDIWKKWIIYGMTEKEIERDYVVLQEEEVGIEWETSNGTKVTGRPDLVIARINKKQMIEAITRELNGEMQSLLANYGIEASPNWESSNYYRIAKSFKAYTLEKGYELKAASSLWTARDILLDMAKVPHILQAAHYSSALKIPFELWYTSYVNYAIGWSRNEKNMFAPLAEKHPNIISVNDNGNPKSVLPFQLGFHIEFNREGYIRLGVIDRFNKGRIDWIDTLLPLDGIQKFYDKVARKDLTLGEYLRNIKYDGKELNWKLKQYCPLGELCCQSLSKSVNYEVWKQSILDTTGKDSQGDTNE